MRTLEGEKEKNREDTEESHCSQRRIPPVIYSVCETECEHRTRWTFPPPLLFSPLYPSLPLLPSLWCDCVGVRLSDA